MVAATVVLRAVNAETVHIGTHLKLAGLCEVGNSAMRYVAECFERFRDNDLLKKTKYTFLLKSCCLVSYQMK